MEPRSVLVEGCFLCPANLLFGLEPVVQLGALLAKIKPYKQNARKIPQKAIDKENDAGRESGGAPEFPGDRR